MINSDNAREREDLNLQVQLNRAEMRRAWWKVENLEAAIETAKELEKRVKKSRPDRKTENGE
jgi:hypothetical protein